ncbi:hypothetical protein DRJ25_01625 [Candidatus Woesearchaeota archaeon]|nr:MAG: hypothetical protein DRJ25_01625 [Candidatus Woesearchaeota archaeon]
MISLRDILVHARGFVEHPALLLLVIPLVLLLIFLIKRDFIRVKEDPEVRESKRKLRKVVLITRILIIVLLVIAIAGPYTISEKTIKGDAFVQLLVDKSDSMQLFEDTSKELQAALEDMINVDRKDICSGEVSNIGDEILNSLQPGGSILLFSDGNANAGADLGDVALYASKLNVSINAVRLKAKRSDASVTIFGPSKTMSGTDNSFSVRINKAGAIKTVHLKVTLDGETILDEDTSKDAVEFERKFDDGNHQLVASISAANDFFAKNNVFYKTVKVVPPPKVLFVSEKKSYLRTLLDELFDVDALEYVPKDLSKYYAVIVNDLPASSLEPAVDVLHDFVSDGNGLVVFGGENSFEEGGYKSSVFESMLPFFVGKPGKKKGDVNVALVIDISGSTGSALGKGKAVDVEKALAIEALKDLSLNTRLGVVVFNTEAKMISAPTYVFEKSHLDDTIASLKDGGGTLISAGIMKAISILGNLAGSKNIILISDGNTQAESAAIEAARYAAKSGFKIYTVGVGESTDEGMMMKLAQLTNGVYFRANQESRLKLLFGDPEDMNKTGGRLGFTILDSNHFITQDLNIPAVITGFNSVAPKTTARLLATTSSGDPLLAVSRLGLGRVVALATDDGSKWAGDLLSKKNSKIISRILNWAIGDPERKSNSFVEAKDTMLGEPTEVIVKSKIPPKAEGVSFYKIDEDTFSASISPESTGFKNVAGAQFAVNYPLEFESVGMNDALELVVRSTGGRIFDAGDVKRIVENAKTRSKRTIVSKNPLLWPFLLPAILIYLLEIFIRRIMRKE